MEHSLFPIFSDLERTATSESAGNDEIVQQQKNGNFNNHESNFSIDEDGDNSSDDDGDDAQDGFYTFETDESGTKGKFIFQRAASSPNDKNNQHHNNGFDARDDFFDHDDISNLKAVVPDEISIQLGDMRCECLDLQQLRRTLFTARLVQNTTHTHSKTTEDIMNNMYNFLNEEPEVEADANVTKNNNNKESTANNSPKSPPPPELLVSVASGGFGIANQDPNVRNDLLKTSLADKSINTPNYSNTSVPYNGSEIEHFSSPPSTSSSPSEKQHQPGNQVGDNTKIILAHHQQQHFQYPSFILNRQVSNMNNSKASAKVTSSPTIMKNNQLNNSYEDLTRLLGRKKSSASLVPGNANNLTSSTNDDDESSNNNTANLVFIGAYHVNQEQSFEQIVCRELNERTSKRLVLLMNDPASNTAASQSKDFINHNNNNNTNILNNMDAIENRGGGMYADRQNRIDMEEQKAMKQSLAVSRLGMFSGQVALFLRISNSCGYRTTSRVVDLNLTNGTIAKLCAAGLQLATHPNVIYRGKNPGVVTLCFFQAHRKEAAARKEKKLEKKRKRQKEMERREKERRREMEVDGNDGNDAKIHSITGEEDDLSDSSWSEDEDEEEHERKEHVTRNGKNNDDDVCDDDDDDAKIETANASDRNFILTNQLQKQSLVSHQEQLFLNRDAYCAPTDSKTEPTPAVDSDQSIHGGNKTTTMTAAQIIAQKKAAAAVTKKLSSATDERYSGFSSTVMVAGHSKNLMRFDRGVVRALTMEKIQHDAKLRKLLRLKQTSEQEAEDGQNNNNAKLPCVEKEHNEEEEGVTGNYFSSRQRYIEETESDDNDNDNDENAIHSNFVSPTKFLSSGMDPFSSSSASPGNNHVLVDRKKKAVNWLDDPRTPPPNHADRFGVLDFKKDATTGEVLMPTERKMYNSAILISKTPDPSSSSVSTRRRSQYNQNSPITNNNITHGGSLAFATSLSRRRSSASGLTLPTKLLVADPSNNNNNLNGPMGIVLVTDNSKSKIIVSTDPRGYGESKRLEPSDSDSDDELEAVARGDIPSFTIDLKHQVEEAVLAEKRAEFMQFALAGPERNNLPNYEMIHQQHVSEQEQKRRMTVISSSNNIHNKSIVSRSFSQLLGGIGDDDSSRETSVGSSQQQQFRGFRLPSVLLDRNAHDNKHNLVPGIVTTSNNNNKNILRTGSDIFLPPAVAARRSRSNSLQVNNNNALCGPGLISPSLQAARQRRQSLKCASFGPSMNSDNTNNNRQLCGGTTPPDAVRNFEKSMTQFISSTHQNPNGNSNSTSYCQSTSREGSGLGNSFNNNNNNNNNNAVVVMPLNLADPYYSGVNTGIHDKNRMQREKEHQVQHHRRFSQSSVSKNNNNNNNTFGDDPNKRTSESSSSMSANNNYSDLHQNQHQQKRVNPFLQQLFEQKAKLEEQRKSRRKSLFEIANITDNNDDDHGKNAACNNHKSPPPPPNIFGSTECNVFEGVHDAGEKQNENHNNNNNVNTSSPISHKGSSDETTSATSFSFSQKYGSLHQGGFGAGMSHPASGGESPFIRLPSGAALLNNLNHPSLLGSVKKEDSTSPSPASQQHAPVLEPGVKTNDNNSESTSCVIPLGVSPKHGNANGKNNVTSNFINSPHNDGARSSRSLSLSTPRLGSTIVNNQDDTNDQTYKSNNLLLLTSNTNNNNNNSYPANQLPGARRVLSNVSFAGNVDDYFNNARSPQQGLFPLSSTSQQHRSPSSVVNPALGTERTLRSHSIALSAKDWKMRSRLVASTKVEAASKKMEQDYHTSGNNQQAAEIARRALKKAAAKRIRRLMSRLMKLRVELWCGKSLTDPNAIKLGETQLDLSSLLKQVSKENVRSNDKDKQQQRGQNSASSSAVPGPTFHTVSSQCSSVLGTQAGCGDEATIVCTVTLKGSKDNNCHHHHENKQHQKKTLNNSNKIHNEDDENVKGGFLTEQRKRLNNTWTAPKSDVVIEDASVVEFQRRIAEQQLLSFISMMVSQKLQQALAPIMNKLDFLDQRIHRLNAMMNKGAFNASSFGSSSLSLSSPRSFRRQQRHDLKNNRGLRSTSANHESFKSMKRSPSMK